MNNKDIGILGEQYATDFLMKQGINIVKRNFRCKLGEIDIIGEDDNELIFVEVKTRTSLCFGLPSEAVDYFKKKHIYRVAKFFMTKYKLENYLIRFDVIEVLLHNNKPEINYLKNVEII